MEITDVHVLWYPPVEAEEFLKSGLYYGSGLYYITNVCENKETSFYIGKSIREIKNRVRAHVDYWEGTYSGKLLVRVGKIVCKYKVTADLINTVKSAIIFEHGELFPRNIKQKNLYSYKKVYKIKNTGDYFQLKRTVNMRKHPESE